VGREIDRDRFEKSDYELFSRRLESALGAFRELLERPGFGQGPPSIGVEVELCLVDGAGRPLPLNRSILAQTLDPRVTLELDRFNLELNTRGVETAGRPFSELSLEIEGSLEEIRGAAAGFGGRPVTVGILPTLRRNDLGARAMTDAPRFRALVKGLQRLRGGPLRIEIEGQDPLRLRSGDVTLEGATTALQIHLRVDAGRFADHYNASQIAIAPVLAVSGNSPLFLGHRLWEETRIPLFARAVDGCPPDASVAWPPPRSSFGHGWVRQGVFELFAESVGLYVPLLPVSGSEDCVAVARAGGVPELAELRLHHGTVWRWNRSLYDPAQGGHLRIEMRALPSGPSVVDMMASAAFLVGLVRALADEVEGILPAMPFEYARRNFVEAARDGLQAELLWPSPSSLRLRRAAELIPDLLAVARRGLAALGVDAAEAERFLGVVAERAASGRTGARWQRKVLEQELERRPSRAGALASLLERYLEGQASGEPVHRWPQ
jgi:gamma-glutamyl:cysteine ligase YbdK (ATP-grasp superfamily)